MEGSRLDTIAPRLRRTFQEATIAEQCAALAAARAADALRHALSANENDHLESLYEAIESAVDRDAAIEKIEGLLGERS